MKNKFRVRLPIFIVIDDEETFLDSGAEVELDEETAAPYMHALHPLKEGAAEASAAKKEE